MPRFASGLLALHALALPMLSTAATTCESLKTSLNLAGVTANVIQSQTYKAGTNISVAETSPGQAKNCSPYVVTIKDICRIAINFTTSNRSTTYFEAWLPSKKSAWNGRFLATGNGGLNGCIDYANVAYTAGLGFAAVGDNGGHDGNAGDGTAFINNHDVLLDFAYRARHTSVVAGKQIVKQYYGDSCSKSYYYGCSTGGRQGMKAAQMFPEDFDGIVAGAPAVDFNHLASWSAHFLTLTGQNTTDPRFLTQAQWALVNAEVYKQCDLLDGVADQILEDSSICNFNPETLLCTQRDKPSGIAGCLTNTQVTTVREVFSPLTGLNNTFLYPRLSPSAELAAAAPQPFAYLNGNLIGPGTGYFGDIIYGDPSWDPTSYSALDAAYADSLDASNGYISSYNGDLSPFRSRGGKILTYHGQQDPIIAGENSMRWYLRIATAMKASNKELDDFYRFFRISGMGHCSSGPGGWEFGQTSTAVNGSQNILLDMVKWVEEGKAPDVMVGTKFVNDSSALGVELKRPHCRYPYRTTYKGGDATKPESWGCKYIEDWQVCDGPSDKVPKLC